MITLSTSNNVNAVTTMPSTDPMIETLQSNHLISAIEQMLKESVLCWSNWDKLEVKELKDCTITRSPVSFPFFNNVMEPSLKLETASQRI